ncbi:MAG: two-component regulator propeller domain-containing protein [Acidobacteriaceae bacterium]|nr:two-component regulator propeller domain-containing protein [Acidobacteriaceae bacterium]
MHFTPVQAIRGGVRSLFLFPDGRLWVGTSDQGSFLLDGNSTRPLAMPAALPSNAVFTVLQDRNGSYWVGTQAGLARLAHPETSIIFLPKSSDSVSQTISADPKGHLWVASTNLYDIQNGHAKEVTLPGLAQIHVVTVLRDHDGCLWLGTFDQGIYQLKDGHLIHFPMQINLRDIRAMLQRRDGTIWIAGGSGISRFRDGKIEPLSGMNGLPAQVSGAHTLFEDHTGALWIGADQGLYLWRNDALETNKLTKTIQNVPVWAMHEDPSGALWVGTNGRGIYRWKNGRVDALNASNALLPSKIYAILQTQDGEIWISSPNGIYSISGENLNAFADDSHHEPSARLYTALSGVYTTQMFGGLQPAGAITADGSLWFPSLYGPVRITAKQQDSIRSIPPVVIRSVLVNGKESSVESLQDLAATSTRLDIQYGAIDLLPQSNLRFRYKLEGFDEQWNEAGTQRIASYTNLPPGRYTFRVAAYSIEAPSKSSEAELLIKRRPPYYHTWWFFLLCGAILTCAVALFHFIRTRQIAKQFRAVIKERNRVAREMHDTLLRGCTGVSSLLEAMAATSQFPQEPGHTLLESSRLQISSTIEEARQAIWGLRLDHGPQASLSALLREIAQQLEHQFGIPIFFQAEGREALIRQNISHQLLMATREALFNALRHATPTEVRLTIYFLRNQIQIEVTDNGTGFDTGFSSFNDGREHYGLSVMRERVESLGGTLHIRSSSEDGTSLVMLVSLSKLRNRKDWDANNA